MGEEQDANKCQGRVLMCSIYLNKGIDIVKKR